LFEFITKKNSNFAPNLKKTNPNGRRPCDKNISTNHPDLKRSSVSISLPAIFLGQLKQEVAMTSQKTFYVSQHIGSKIYDVNGNRLRNVIDIAVNTAKKEFLLENSLQSVVGLKTKMNGSGHYFNFEYVQISKQTILK
jgi:hypothetical protein